MLPVERLSLSMPNRRHFATLNGSEHSLLRVSRINEAEQWDIVAADGFRVTLTMASFWSNRMWSWIGDSTERTSRHVSCVHKLCPR